MRGLSKAFEIERMKINNEIHDERSAAHSHCTINKIEEDVKEFIRLLELKAFSNSCQCNTCKEQKRDFVIDVHDLKRLAGDALCTTDVAEDEQ